jgi:hypothetical protein
VSDDPIALLSYYLHCVNTCVPLVPDQFCAFGDYWGKSVGFAEELLRYAYEFKPTVLANKVWFAVPNDVDIGSLNAFYTPDDIRCLVDSSCADAIPDCVTNGEVTAPVCKTMVYKNRWMTKCYFQPLGEVSSRLDELRCNGADPSDPFRSSEIPRVRISRSISTPGKHGSRWMHGRPLVQGDWAWAADESWSECAGCLAAFCWYWRRKHHCRNCGRIYCSECTVWLHEALECKECAKRA